MTDSTRIPGFPDIPDVPGRSGPAGLPPLPTRGDDGRPVSALADADKEWLEADGLGGFASGTVSGVRTRRYHALLLSATLPPTGRLVLVNGVEAWLEGPQGIIPLSSQHYAPDTIHPDGWRRIVEFSPTPWPTWRFGLNDDAPASISAASGLSVTHEIFAAGDGGDVILRWRLDATGPLNAAVAAATVATVAASGTSSATPAATPSAAASSGLRLCVRPLLSVRDYHALHHRNDAFDFQPSGSGGRISWRPYGDRPAVSALGNGTYRHEPLWFDRFLYTAEQERGLDAVEDLASPGYFVFDLAREPALLVLRAGDNRDMRVVERVARAEAAERLRRAAPTPRAFADPTFAALGRTVDSYFAERGRGATVLAGFPWFTDWGRDTFISLRGLALATGRLDEAAAILGEWATTVSEGMLPNRFPDSGETPEYNSVDASLWFVIALHAYLQTGHASPALAKTLQAAANDILDGYRRGTRFGIGARDDGLIHAGLIHDNTASTQLTWMDARIGIRPVTPRIGKPVEIQALWINALRIASSWRPEWASFAERAQTAFVQRFVDEKSGALFDIVDADGVPGAIDRSVRPNQIFAVGGLPYRVVNAATATAIVAQVERELLTPMGLRTLSPNDPRYVSHYRGAPDARDGAYHQGTVWPWLMGPFVEAWLRTQSFTAAGRDGTPSDALKHEARTRFVSPLLAHLGQAGLGHVSEIADGDAPHTPRGAPFQAWSLAELLRIERLL